jgi:hypothetical protein
MSGKKKPADLAPGIDPELIELRRQAMKGRIPSPSVAEEDSIPKLWKLLAPAEVRLGDGNGSGPVERAIREPMMILNYSRRVGTWVVSITDKLLRNRVTITVSSPLTAIAEAEAKLVSGDYHVESIEKRVAHLKGLDKLLD